jgi:Glycosyl hydrolases family 16
MTKKINTMKKILILFLNMILLAFPIVSAIAQVPKRGTSPSVAAVNDCPNLAFHDDFNETSFDMWPGGPIPAPPPVMWNPWGKVDGTCWWAPDLSFSAYKIANGYISLRLSLKNGKLLSAGIGSAAYDSGGAVNGKPTGFLAAPPCYWEVSVWMPELSADDAPNTSGLWPSVSFYSDPSTKEKIEYDLFECYSGPGGSGKPDYTKVYTTWHDWAANTGNGTTITVPDISKGWHVWGIWIDTTTTHWYLDGKEIYTAPTKGSAPLYIVIANTVGGGWPINLSTSKQYFMKVAYVACWTEKRVGKIRKQVERRARSVSPSSPNKP